MSESEILSDEETHSFSINISELSDDELNRIENNRLREVMKAMKKHSASEESDGTSPSAIPRRSREPYVKIIFVKAIPPQRLKST
jgi:hypothetical protein